MNTKAGIYRSLRKCLKPETAETTEFCSLFISSFLCAVAWFNLSFHPPHWLSLISDLHGPVPATYRDQWAKGEALLQIPTSIYTRPVPCMWEVGHQEHIGLPRTELSCNRGNSGRGRGSPQSLPHIPRQPSTAKALCTPVFPFSM